MAKKTEKPETNETTDDAAQTDNAADAETLLAAKQEAGEAGRPWNLKASTEIPERFNGTELSILQPKRGSTPEETWENILVFCDGNDEAALDTFNSAYRLANQKDCKLAMVDKANGLAEIQELSNRHVATPTSRGKGGSKTSAKAKVAKAEAKAQAAAQSMEEMLADLEAVNPEAAAKYRERLANMG